MESAIHRAEEEEEERGSIYSEEEIEVATASCAVCKICIAKGIDSWSPVGCKFCVARAAALHRIKQAGGDSVKAAEDSAARAGVDVIVVKQQAVPETMDIATDGEVVNKPTTAGVVKETIKVPEAHIKWLLASAKPRPLRPLREDFLRKNPWRRESILAAALANLSTIEQKENILAQFFNKGYAELEVHVDYGNMCSVALNNYYYGRF